jgi:hypothetical protein
MLAALTLRGCSDSPQLDVRPASSRRSAQPGGDPAQRRGQAARCLVPDLVPGARHDRQPRVGEHRGRGLGRLPRERAALPRDNLHRSVNPLSMPGRSPRPTASATDADVCSKPSGLTRTVSGTGGASARTAK